MNIYELVLLSLVLIIWLISIVLCIRRFNKIRYIDRNNNNTNTRNVINQQLSAYSDTNSQKTTEIITNSTNIFQDEATSNIIINNVDPNRRIKSVCIKQFTSYDNFLSDFSHAKTSKSNLKNSIISLKHVAFNNGPISYTNIVISTSNLNQSSYNIDKQEEYSILAKCKSEPYLNETDRDYV